MKSWNMCVLAEGAATQLERSGIALVLQRVRPYGAAIFLFVLANKNPCVL